MSAPSTERAGVVAVAFLASAAVFRRVLVGSRVYVALDYAILHMPFRQEIARAVAEAQVPLWTSGLWSGAPFLANGDTATLYPLQLFFFLADPPRAIGVVLWVHVSLALVTMYAFARAGLGAGVAGSAIAAAIYAFNGYAMTHTGFLSFVYLQPWPPLVFLAVDRAARREGTFRWCALGAAAVAMALLTGQPQQLHLALLWVPLIALARTQPARRVVLAVAFVVAGGVALSAAQVVPEWEYVRMTDRGGGLDLDDAAFGALPYESPLEFLLPDYDHSYFGENAGWIGASGLALALGGGVALARRRRWLELAAWTAMATVSFVVALGTATPVFAFVRAVVPGVSQFRFPVRWVYLVTFALACLAAYGADALLAAGWWRRRLSTVRVAAAVALVVVVAVELVVADSRLEWNHPGSADVYRPSTFAAIVGSSPEPGRVMSVASPQPDEMATAARRLAAATPLLADLPSVTGMGGLGRPGQARLIDSLVTEPLTYDDAATARRDEVWRGLGVRWVVARPSQVNIAANGALRAVAGQDGFVLYELDGGGRRAFSYCGVTRAASDRAAAEWALGDAYTAERLAIAGVPGAEPGGACGSATVQRSSRHAVDVAVELPEDGWLLLADTWYPGWRASVDGVGARVWRGNGFYRAVRVPAGAHRVRFEFVPTSFRVGVLVSAVSWLAFGGLAGYWLLLFMLRRRDTASSMTSRRLQHANRTSDRPASTSS